MAYRRCNIRRLTLLSGVAAALAMAMPPAVCGPGQDAGNQVKQAPKGAPMPPITPFQSVSDLHNPADPKAPACNLERSVFCAPGIGSVSDIMYDAHGVVYVIAGSKGATWVSPAGKIVSTVTFPVDCARVQIVTLHGETAFLSHGGDKIAPALLDATGKVVRRYTDNDDVAKAIKESGPGSSYALARLFPDPAPQGGTGSSLVLRLGSPEFVVTLEDEVGTKQSILRIYDERQTLVYQETYPIDSDCIKAMASPDGQPESLLVAAGDEVWKFDVAGSK